MSFAENLKQLRKEKQLSQEELAEMLDVMKVKGKADVETDKLDICFLFIQS